MQKENILRKTNKMLFPIKNYENLYSITKTGQIYNHRFKRFLTGDKNTVGYKRVILCKDKKRKRFFVHRLVAQTFIPNINNKKTVNHKDGNKTNNNIENLEWATQQEQQLHAWKTGLAKISKNFIQEKNRRIDKESIKRLVLLYKNNTLKVSQEATFFKVTISAIYKAVYRAINKENNKCGSAQYSQLLKAF